MAEPPEGLPAYGIFRNKPLPAFMPGMNCRIEVIIRINVQPINGRRDLFGMDVVAHPVQPERRDPQQPFHALSWDELFSLPGSIMGGLTSGQAQAGLARYGYNDSSRIQKSPVIFQVLEHFKNLLVMILLMDGQGFPV